jgi:trk system potassium uptake protein TrkA
MNIRGMLNRIKNKGKYTIIVGCGRLGASLANQLSDKGENVLVIDRDEQSFRKLSQDFGGLTVKGDGTEIPVLNDVNIRKASSVIAVTNHDNTNVMIAQIAKEVFHIDNVIARLYDPDRECVYREFQINTICPVVLSSARVGQMMGDY